MFIDNSVGVTNRGRDVADVVRNYGTAFSDMHRELYQIYADGNVVVVQLALQGTHDGPLQLPFGELPATGKHMDAPCCDVFELEDGKIKRFDCYHWLVTDGADPQNLAVLGDSAGGNLAIAISAATRGQGNWRKQSCPKWHR